MSPEQAAGKPVDKRGDLWAFAVVLLEMLTGRPVFAGETVPDVLAAVLTTEPDWRRLPAETPPVVRTLLRRCLEKDHTRRLDSATAARMQIDDALATWPPARAGKSALEPGDGTSRRVGRCGVALPSGAHGRLVRLWQQDFFWRNPLAGATVERLTDFEGDEFDAAISTDGKVTAFLSDRDGPLDAWVSQIGSDEFVNLTKGRFQLTTNRITRQAGFSIDGGSVWFLQQVEELPVRWTSWLVPAFGGAPRPFVEGGLNPVWSPDDQNLVYHSADPGDPIFIADRNGSNPQTTAPGTVGGAQPSSDMGAGRPLHLLRERHSPDRGDGHLAYPGVDERCRGDAGADDFPSCVGRVPCLARCANVDLHSHRRRRFGAVALRRGCRASDPSPCELRYCGRVSVRGRQHRSTAASGRGPRHPHCKPLDSSPLG